MEKKPESCIQRALISVFNKTGLLPLVHELAANGIEIIASGGTAEWLTGQGYSVIPVSDFTGFPEIMGGRVKTLHPKIYAGLLRRTGIDKTFLPDEAIKPIDLVIVNLYPFAETVADPNCTFADAIEKIDIGGPTLLRAAAKNHEVVTVVTDPSDYSEILDEIKKHGQTTLPLRRRLANKVFLYTSQYDQSIYEYLADTKEVIERFPPIFQPHYRKKLDLRYGENPHQSAALYSDACATPYSLPEAQLLQGKPLSYCNLLDSDAALNIVRSLDRQIPGCVIVKHATPCGAAQGNNLLTAFQKALSADPVSAFGGIIAFNQPLDKDTAHALLAQPLIEVILAPDISPETLALFKNKTQWRILATGSVDNNSSRLNLHSIPGGLLVQELDPISELDSSSWQVVTKRHPNSQEIADLKFAWKIAAFAKSNAIVLARDQQTLGIGSGQTSRVFSAQIAILKAKELKFNLEKSVAASDGFFPFADGVMTLANAGISTIIQPGGSKRDAEVILAADESCMAMIFTHVRHFRH